MLATLQEIIGYKGQISSLLKLLTALGFQWRKMQDIRHILTE